MGYYLRLKDKDGKTCPRKEKEQFLGSLICIGGSPDMEYNITDNYSAYYNEMGGIRAIYGKTGKESLSMLRAMRDNIRAKYYNDELGRWKFVLKKKKVPIVDGEVLRTYELFNIDPELVEWKEVEYVCDEGETSDYWEPTALNAMEALEELIRMAEECPEGIWDGD